MQRIKRVCAAIQPLDSTSNVSRFIEALGCTAVTQSDAAYAKNEQDCKQQYGRTR